MRSKSLMASAFAVAVLFVMTVAATSSAHHR
jgi:hypothetical protein